MTKILMILSLLVMSLAAKAETYVVCVGIGTYADSKVRNLSKAEKDAKAMAGFYKKGTENVMTITGKYATKTQILESLRSQFGRARAGDKIVFYFSGHGYPGGFCPYEMSRLEEGLSYSEVIKVMSQSKAKDKMIFADACNSGLIREGSVVAIPETGSVMLFLSSRGNEYSIDSPLLSNGYFRTICFMDSEGKRMPIVTKGLQPKNFTTT